MKKLSLLLSFVLILSLLCACGDNNEAILPEAENDFVFSSVGTGEETCSLLILCNTALSSDKLSPQKRELLPEDGVILSCENVEINDEENAFELLLRLAKENKLHLDFSYTPAYNSHYIKGISNLYERDCGDASGWLYMVNGETASVAADSYIPKDGDTIAFVYSCEFGNDLSVYSFEK